MMPVMMRMWKPHGAGGDPYSDNVVLLWHFDAYTSSPTFDDFSLSNHTSQTFGSGSISSTQSVFGGAAFSFNSTGEGNGALAQDLPGDFAFGTGDFTIELWVYRDSDPFSEKAVILSNNPGNTTGWSFVYNSGNLYFTTADQEFSIGGVSAPFTMSLDTWYYLAVTRESGTLRFFVDGTQVGTNQSFTTDIVEPSVTHALYLFTFNKVTTGYGYDFGLRGYADELRITKGVCRYTTNYSTPTAAFPDP